MSFVKKILFLRPFNQEETKGHSQSCLRIDTDAKRSSITVLGPTGQSSVFDFYNCYWSANDHSSLSEDIRQYAFQNVGRKFSTCVLLYGPMNTGKSYVLLGGPEHEGLLLTTLREVFTALPRQRVMLLVYEIDDETEQIFDLIAGELAGSFSDVVQKRVGSFNQAIATLEDALSRRHASTHTFFTIKLSDKKTGQVVVLDFVLLENECKEKDYPMPRPSFCHLHELIHSMGSKNEPDFSKCKLTEHFQEHFQNGRYRVIMLATVGPSAKDYDQIMRVLTYCTSPTVSRFSSSGPLLPPPPEPNGTADKTSYPPQPQTPMRTAVAAPPPYLSSSQQEMLQQQQQHHAPPPPSPAATILLTPSTPLLPAGMDSPLLSSGIGSPNSREFDALYRCVHKLTQLLEDYDRGVISTANGHRSGIRSLFPSLTNTINERIQALEDCIMLADQCRMRATPLENSGSGGGGNSLYNNLSHSMGSLPSPVPSPQTLLPAQPYDNPGGGGMGMTAREQKVLSALSRLGEVDASSPQNAAADKKAPAKTKSNVFDVLLVEDVPVSSKLGLHQLRKAAYKPLSCENGSEALAKFKAHWETLKFVLMDINMPELNGIQATEMIRNWEVENRTDGKKVVIFGLTGNVDAKSLRTYRDSGMNGCIVKGSNLVEALKKAVQLLYEKPNEFVNLCNVEMQEGDELGSPRAHSSSSSSTSSSSSSPLSPSSGSSGGGASSELEDLANLRKSALSNAGRRVSKTSLESELAEARAVAATPTPQSQPREPGEDGSCPQIGTPNPNLSFRRLMAKKFVSKFGSADDELDLGEDSSSRRGNSSSGNSKSKGLKKRKPFSLDDIPDVEGGFDLPPVPNMESKDILTPTNTPKSKENSPPPPPIVAKVLEKDNIIIDVPRPSFKDDIYTSASSSPSSSSTSATTPTSSASPTTPITISRSPSGGTASFLRPGTPPDYVISPAAAVPPSGSASVSPPRSPTQPGLRGSLHMKSAVKKPTLLLVEDVKVSQKLGLAALTRANFKVAVAQNGDEAVEMFKKHHESLEVVLMDVLMPGMNGIEATEIIRQFEQENLLEPTTVLGLTGNVDQANLVEYERCGMNGCIVKGKHLEQAVNKVLDQLNESPAFVSYVS